MSWRVSAVPLPSGMESRDAWIDEHGRLTDRPVDNADVLPGRFVLHGLVDAHAHPATAASSSGPVARTVEDAAAALTDWGRSGIAFVRDMGSPGGITLLLPRSPGMPRVVAAGRFLAPAGRYFPSLLPEAAAEDELAALARAELARGARWVKIVADFPRVVDGEPVGSPEPTYALDTIAAAVTAVHEAGGRVAVHTTTSMAKDLIEAGVDSIEHGTALDPGDLDRMAQRGTAWTPTLGAIFGTASPSDPNELRHRRSAIRELFAELIPLAARLGVPILTGTDAVGTLAREVELLTEFGLGPTQALEAATTSAYAFLGEDPGRLGERTMLVTYDADPRNDPRVLSSPRAVVMDGARIR